MHFYLANWTGDGTEGNEYRPEMDADIWATIDLRPDGTLQEGWTLVATETQGTGGIHLGEALDEPSNQLRNAVRNRLGVQVEATTLRGLIVELLIMWGETDIPGRTRWKRLKQDHRGRHRIAMLGETLYDAPLVQGIVVTESFDKADSAILGPDLTWSELSHDWEVASNRAQVADDHTPLSVARAESNLASDNNYAQFSLLAVHSDVQINNASPVCRMPSSATSGYNLKRRSPTSGDADYRLERMEDVSVTALTSFVAQALDLPEVIRVEADGSTITGYIDSVEKASTTDTGITTGVRGGIAGFMGQGGLPGEVVIDDFEAGDLGDLDNVIALTAATALYDD